MAGIFSSVIFNVNIFNTGAGAIPPPVVEDVVKTGTGGIDKPTGYIRRKKLTKKKIERIEERLEDQLDAQIEITARLREEFGEIVSRETPIEQMSLKEIESEIGQRLREKLDQEELELLALVAAAAGH